MLKGKPTGKVIVKPEWEGEALAEPKRQRIANSEWRLVRLDFGSLVGSPSHNLSKRRMNSAL